MDVENTDAHFRPERGWRVLLVGLTLLIAVCITGGILIARLAP